MAVNLTRLFAVFSVLCVLATTAESLDTENVKSWAIAAGENLSDFFNKATHFTKLQEAYDLQAAQLSVTRKNGSAIVDNMKRVLQGVLQKKIKSIKYLAKMSQELRSNYTDEDAIEDVEYFDTKQLDGLSLAIDPKFSKSIAINKSSSVVHIPTDVYSKGVSIVNTIKWTSGLDPYFKENDQEDPSLLWQYFGSSNGVYRVYPGFEWQEPSEKDIFDNRRRGWYIQGSNSPKDIVLLLDLSGSMAGQKLAILKLAAMSLLETLQENDFVNIVVVYADDEDKQDFYVKAYMVCLVKKDGSIEKNKDKIAECSNHLLQATEQNKKYLQSFLPTVKARGIAAIRKGFNKSIEVLKDSRENRNFSSSNCTQAIIVFTDGIEQHQAKLTSDFLKDYNKNKQIHVFAYVVGREKSATDSLLKKITDSNRGCCFRIETMSDVREKVLEYVKVLSRPLGFTLKDDDVDPSWTPIYLDKLVTMGLISNDTKKYGRNFQLIAGGQVDMKGLGLMTTLVAPVFDKSKKEELLGVVGTDVALKTLENSVPGSEVGVNGYGFAINNNGFVLFHPGLKKKWVRKYCEPANGSKLAAKRVKNPPNIALDELEYNAAGDNFTKLMREMIDKLTGNMSFKSRLLSQDKHRLSWSEDFHYFYSPIENTSFSAAVAIPKMSLYGLDATGFTDLKEADQFLDSSDSKDIVIVAPWKICPNTEVAGSSQIPVYDSIYPTAQDIITDTQRDNNCVLQKLKNLLFDANITKVAAAKHWNAEQNKEKGVENVFVATHGGIMRLLNSSEITLQRDYIKEQFYTQAAQYAQHADKGDQIIVFSAPYEAPNYQYGVNESATITASAPVIVTKDNNKVVAAVAGMHVKQNDFTKLLLIPVHSDKCNSTKGCVARLIDDDGFVVASNQEDESEVGKFFGVLEGAVMSKFVNLSLFERLNFTSIQEECQKPKQDTSSARTLLNPLFAVTSYAQFWTQTVFWSLAQFNIYSFFSRGSVAMAEGAQNNLIPCSKELKFYKGKWEKRKKDAVISCTVHQSECDWKSVYMEPVPKTNLRLVVVKKLTSLSCTCEDDKQLTTKPTDVLPNAPSPRNLPYRKPPEPTKSHCDNMNAEQSKPPCASASSFSSPESLTMIFLLILALFIPYNNWR